MRHLFLSLFLALTLPTVAELGVQPDSENNTAVRLAGSWSTDSGLTTRLGDSSGPETLDFRLSPEVVAEIPARYHGFLSKHRIYTAGWVRFPHQGESLEAPFLLLESHGNPHLVFFLPRDGDPMGDPESAFLTVVRGQSEEQDLLFVGGDHFNEPFRAYRREPATDIGALTPPGSSALPGRHQAAGSMIEF